jgi:hypothetical protein
LTMKAMQYVKQVASMVSWKTNIKVYTIKHMVFVIKHTNVLLHFFRQKQILSGSWQISD